jgi:hypothetical protein
MRALVAMLPEEKVGIVILTNQNPSNVDEAIMFRFFDLELHAPPRDWGREMLDSMTAVRKRGAAALAAVVAARKPGTTPSLPIAQYAGTYSDPAYGDAVISEQSGKLTIKFGNASGTLSHWHYDTFRIDWNTPAHDWQLATFKLNAGGKAVSVNAGPAAELIRQ